MNATPGDGLLVGEDNKARCAWHAGKPDYVHYHDTEWGHPVANDRDLFEKICLEGFQAGLSWYTILKKRDNFRAAFANFEIDRLIEFTDNDIERCLADKGIIRHRKKIESVINNAKRAQALKAEFGSLAVYFWSWEPGPDDRPEICSWQVLKTITQPPIAQALSKDLKKRNWSFVGPTTIYAFMQAMGLVNDHVEGCFCREIIEKERAIFTRPQ